MVIEKLTVHEEAPCGLWKSRLRRWIFCGRNRFAISSPSSSKPRLATAFRVLVFKSADPDYFISHVDVTGIREYREEAAQLTGEASLASPVEAPPNTCLASSAAPGRSRSC